LLFAIRYWFYL